MSDSLIEPSLGIPAHIALLLNEPFDLGDPLAVRKRLKAMAGDLRDQAESSRSTLSHDLGADPSIFRVVLSGGLDLFAQQGACQELGCRMGYAVQVSRSIALMADQVAMKDFIEEDLLDLRRRPTNSEIDRFVPDVYVLNVLRPLIAGGVLRFIAPYLPACQECISEFDQRAQETTDEVLRMYAGRFSVERTSEYTAVDAGPLYDPPLFIRTNKNLTDSMSDEDLIRAITYRGVRGSLWDARDAAVLGGCLFSNSQVGLSGLLTQDGRRMNPGEFRAFAGQRAAELPWVQGLTVSQTIQLRQEASSALPALREFLARKLVAQAESTSESDANDYVAELREQAAAVRAELAIVTSKSPSISKNAAGILGLGVSALSLGSAGPISAIGNLLTTLGLIHSIPAGSSTHEKLLKTKPGYVLVAAQDILAHAG